ncbi:hypothetical protein IM40_02175 [Candidatus Paracaedimonas acanthamoebae]|nr:hypothetical protein IM40_02175 [Candidatus Paracaedimonas acanthamoebae]
MFYSYFSTKKLMNNLSYCVSLRLIDRFEPIKAQTILNQNSVIKFGVPPAPTIEGREKSKVSLPSILYNTYKQEKDSINEQTINKFGMDSMPNDEEYFTSRKAFPVNSVQ